MEDGDKFFNEKKYEEAIVEYKKVLKSDVSDSVKYSACMQLFHAYEDSGNRENGMYYLVRSYHHDKTRIDGIYNLIVHYCCEGQNDIAHYYYDFVKDWYTANYHRDFSDHPDKHIYDFFLPYYMIIVSQKIGRLDTASFVSKVLCTKKHRNVSQWFIRNIVHNIQFVIKNVDIELLQSYISFLVDSGYDISTVGSIPTLERNGIVLNVPPRFTPEECKNSKNILFYTGFANPWWNYTYSISNALGGSETAIAYLAMCFPKDYTIYVTGEVAEETVGNVKYVHLRNIQKLLEDKPMHTVVISRYVAFFEMFKFWSYQTFVWAHDTALMHYGCDLNVHQILDKWHKKIDGMICLTQWHKELFQKHYPQLADRIHIINNGIKDDLFNLNVPKVPNRFVYTSCSNRGLKRLLELWPQILEKMPDAELKLASYVKFPNNQEDERMNEYIQRTPSIQHLGKLGSRELYEIISSSEYWLYPTCWHETSCITALEMLRCGVICIYYPVAGLPFTMGSNGFAVKEGEEVDTIMKLTDFDKKKQIFNGKRYVNQCSWMDRFKHNWQPLIFNDMPIKIINLERRKDRKVSMLEKIKNVYIKNYEFVKAVDGKELQPTRDIYELFKGNDFFYSCGVIGAALTHTTLWKRLVEDQATNYYIILEDDVVFSKDVKDRLLWCCKEFEQQQLEYLLLGANSFNIIPSDPSDNITIRPHDLTKTFNEGAFGYIIHKTAAKKLLAYFSKNRIQYAIDKQDFYINSGVNVSIVSSPIILTECYQLNGEQVDTDIQHHIFRLTFPPFPQNESVWINTFFNTKSLPIKIINLERRSDRKHSIINILNKNNIYNFEITEAVDGKSLKPTKEIYDLFAGNDFNYSSGVVGCALSHFNLWKRLLNDVTTQYYVILEDDVNFIAPFGKEQMNYCCRKVEDGEMEFLHLAPFSRTKHNEYISDLEFIKNDRSRSINEGTGAYIIHKSAARKLVDYITSNSIKWAIDSFNIYNRSGVNYYIVNNRVLSCPWAFKEGDTDIQRGSVSLDFSKMNNATIAFCDWWSEEYGGGRYDFNDNFLTNTLRVNSSKTIKVVEPSESPDVLFFSVFGNNHSKYSNCRKVFFTGEPYAAKADVDFNITFDEDSTNNTRVPLWLCYMDPSLLNERQIPESRQKFCSFIAGNPGPNNIRKTIVEKMSGYRTVDCGGSFMNNIGSAVPRGTNASGKIEFNKQYKFYLALENKDSYKGYCTEKICDAFKSGCIPVYWGHPSVTEDFDSRSFINANDFRTFDDLVEHVKKVDNDDELYRSYFKYPIFTEKWLNILNDKNNTFFKNLAKKILGE